MLIENTVNQYIDKTASGSPTPGGGSVSALVGSLGVALSKMVGELSFNKKFYENLDITIRKEFEENFRELEAQIEELKLIIDKDASAFDDVILAFKLPKDTREDENIRADAIERGYRKALELPLKCANLCYAVLEKQRIFAEYGSVNAITDVGIGVLLIYAALEGSLLNVEINLLGIKDKEYKDKMREEIGGILTKSKELKEELLAIVYQRLAQ